MSMGYSLSEYVTREIRAEMARQDVTQTDLALRLGWTQSAVSRKLDNLRPLRIEELEQIAQTLGISAPALVASAADRMPVAS